MKEGKSLHRLNSPPRSRRELIAGGGRALLGGASLVALAALSAGSASAMPVTRPRPRADAPDIVPATGTGPCDQCAQEVASGQRAAYLQCYAFEGAYQGALTCQRCGHAWSYHA